MINPTPEQSFAAFVSLKCMLFGGYTPPEVPGRVHKLDDPPSKYEIAAKTRKKRIMPSPKRDALFKCFSSSKWQSIAEIAKKSGSTSYYVQRHALKLLNEGVMERRKIEKSKNVRWYEYRLVSKPCK